MFFSVLIDQGCIQIPAYPAIMVIAVMVARGRYQVFPLLGEEAK